jgi:hypothetical protein
VEQGVSRDPGFLEIAWFFWIPDLAMHTIARPE